MEQIKNYIDALFYSLPQTEETTELRENLLAHAEDKYYALLAEGKSSNEAIGTVISEFGSIDELQRELGLGDSPQTPVFDGISYTEGTQVYEEVLYEYNAFKKQYSLIVAVSVALYILSPLLYIVSEHIFPHLSVIPLAFFFVPIAIATGLLIYYGSQEDNYKEMLGLKKKKKEIDTPFKRHHGKDFDGLVWTLATILFLAFGFLWNAWHPGWLIFLVASFVTMLHQYVHRR